MKKTICFVLTMILLVSTFIGCGSNAAKTDTNPSATLPASIRNAPTATAVAEPVSERYKIAVAFTQINPTAKAQMEYLKNYVAPAFNVEFVFSEAIEDVEKLMTFMETAYASGCRAIMNFQNSGVEQANAKANELGMYIINNTPPADNSDIPYCLGYMRPSVESVADMFKTIVEDFVSDGKNHNVIIVSAGAGLGNIEHHASTVAILKALQRKYGLKYNDEIENIAAVRKQTQVETGSDIKILIYPGYPSDTFVPGMSSILQTGEYDILIAVNQVYTQFAVAIDEVEKAYKFNIKVASVAPISDSTEASFTTIDSTGDTSLNMALVNPSCALVGGMFVILYNGLTGHADVVRKDGRGYEFNNPFWLAKNAEEYMKIEKIGVSADTYELSIDGLKEMIKIYNPKVTLESIYEKIKNLNPDTIIAERGLK